MSSDIILETRGLTKEFRGFTAVNNVDLKVQKGHIHALIGPNGAGKSTTMKCLCNLVIPDSGKVIIDGYDLFNIARARILPLLRFVKVVR